MQAVLRAVLASALTLMQAVLRAVLASALTLALTALLAALAAWGYYAVAVDGAGDPAEPRDEPASPQLTIVAMGDSYMSGEGAGTFYRGTDVPGVDSCRRAPTAYSVRVADALDARLHFVACSGARTYNIGSRFTLPGLKPEIQYPDSEEKLQIETLRERADADVVIVSIGGNDALFSDIVTLCGGGGDTCVPKTGKWMGNLDEVVQPALRDLFTEIREIAGPQTHVFVTTYPSPFGKGVRSCADVGMKTDEVGFVRDFLGRLNDQIRLAVEFAGFEEIDLDTALEVGGLCDEADETPTLNGWRRQKPDGRPESPMDVLRGSFHPTERGHELLAERVLAGVRRALESPPPQPPSVPPPGGPEGAPPDLPPTPPPYEPREYGPPLPPFPQDENPCAREAMVREQVYSDGGADHVSGALPDSRVCYRTYKNEWSVTRADAQGRVTVPFPRQVSADVGGYRHVLYRNASGEWVVRLVLPGPSASPPEVSILAAWVSAHSVTILLLVVAALVLMHAVASWIAGRVPWIGD